VKVLVVGPGAVGGLLAASLAEKNEVWVLARTAGVEAGLVLEGLVVDVAGEVRNVDDLKSARAAKGFADAAFFCVQARDLKTAIAFAAPRIGPDTVVVGLQNGGRPLLRAAFGARVVEGAVLFGAKRIAPRECVLVKGSGILLAKDGPARQLLDAAGWKTTVGRRKAVRAR
jgi:ketopantoate reductase